MSAEAFLSSVVEIGIGMAGFAGIIAAVRQRDVTSWNPHHRVLLQMLFTSSGAAVLFSLIPSILVEGGLTKETTWRAGSALLFAWFVAAPGYRLYQARRPDVRFPISRGVMVFIIPLLCLEFVNIFRGESWPYLLGVMGILTNGFATFLDLLFSKTEEAPSD